MSEKREEVNPASFAVRGKNASLVAGISLLSILLIAPRSIPRCFHGRNLEEEKLPRTIFDPIEKL